MKKKFFVSAIYTSPPSTMGGNTKIMLEIIDNLVEFYDFTIFTTEPETFAKNLKNYKEVNVVAIRYPFPKFSFRTHLKEVSYVSKKIDDYFKDHELHKNDFFYSCSDFAPDVLPIINLKKKYKFKWISSLFLFIPNPYENLKNRYGFPFTKYVVYFLYQRYLFSQILKYADLFLITNDYDKKYFPKNFKNKIYAIYGGVNLEDIEKAKKDVDNKKMYDAVFCSRLHPQKGIEGILEVWKMVVEKNPQAKLAIIGNGEKRYEEFLKKKASDLKINNNIKWFGYVNGVEKYKIYLQSKIFLHGTIYDNNGMVAAEALCCNLPVIMYDLPQLKKVYTDGCIKVKATNKVQYAEEIIKMLKDLQYYKSIVNGEKLVKIKEIWDWGVRIKGFDNFINSYD
jgi:glycosyltransferase involved in cell wall biosynthesis